MTEVTEAACTGGYRSGIRFIVDEPSFNGLAIALAFGILVPTLRSLPVIPVVHLPSTAITIPDQGELQ